MNRTDFHFIRRILNTMLLSAFASLFPLQAANLPEHNSGNVRKYKKICQEYIYRDWKGMYREAGGSLKYPFLTPGSEQYSDILWDWDSWLSDVALRQVLLDRGNQAEGKEALAYEQGCILNYLNYGGMDGWIPYWITRDQAPREELTEQIDIWHTNMHKPMLAQHAAFVVQQMGGDAEWLREDFYTLQSFESKYLNFHRHKATGLLYWENDLAIGVDNDPSTFYRPAESSGSIFLNAMMYKELQAMDYLATCLNMEEIASFYRQEALRLKADIQEHCWDPRDRFFYSVDLNLLPVEKPDVAHSPKGTFFYHVGQPRTYDCLIQRFSVWSGFMAMWAGIATPEQAEDIVRLHYRDTAEFNCPAGVRSLSPLEKMYDVRASGNPSSWQGPVWINVNYLVFKALLRYGYEDDARTLAEKTVLLLGRDLERFGSMHEYYLPSNGEPVLNSGFQNWNYLVINMIAWLEGRETVSEF